MILQRSILVRSNLWKSYLLKDSIVNTIRSIKHVAANNRKHSCLCWSITESYWNEFSCKRFYSKDLTDSDIKDTLENQHERDLGKITKIFPLPRMTLNELSTKTPKKIFDIHFKQMLGTSKGNRKLAQGDWLCTYSFSWPEKIKFESTALSKRQAADKVATQALHWLYINKRIDNNGNPIYDRSALDELRSAVNQPIQVNVSQSSVERIDRIWNDYENEIKNIYDKTSRKAASKSMQMVPIARDSTIDNEDFTDDEEDIEGITDLSDIESKTIVHPIYGKIIRRPSETTLLKRNKVIQEKFRLYEEDLTPLPIDQYTEKITSALNSSRVVVLVGTAGCGKSTRAPAALLKACGSAAGIIVSEPRRVAAIGLAQRVASELGEEVGESIGYQVRLQSKPPRPPAGSILYCTSGVLLRRLQSNPGLEGCSHVIIDEAHERDVNTDLSLLLLRRALDINPHLKVLVMSATMDTSIFTRYFSSCPVIDVPGKTYPVEVSYLSDIREKYGLHLSKSMEMCEKEDARPYVVSQEVFEIIKAIDSSEPEGAILVFLPGWADIKAVKSLLDNHFCNPNTHIVLPVHSRLSTADQSKMFTKPPPGMRKIVLATNVAETSITIPDAVYVIDTGIMKENRTKEGTGTGSLETVWVSQAAAKQRMGRAGRVQSGHCFRIYTKEKESNFTPYSTAEILRVPLEQTVLDCKTYAPEEKAQDFLSQLLEPPSKRAIVYAVNDLIDLGALNTSEQLTRLGSLVSRFSLPPRLAFALLLGAVVGNTSNIAALTVHCADNPQIFVDGNDRRAEIREFKRKFSKTSDHIALQCVQNEYEELYAKRNKEATIQWCHHRGLRHDRLHHVKLLSILHLEQLIKSGFLESNPDPEELTKFSKINELTVAVLLAGANSLLTTRRSVKTKGKLATVTEMFTTTGDRAHIGTESVNYAISKHSNKTHLATYFGGQHSNDRRALVVYQTSLIPPQTALLFSKGDICEDVDEAQETSTLTLPKHRLSVQIPFSQSSSILRAREMLWKTFQFYVERDLKTLDYNDHVTVSRFKVRLMKAIGRVLMESHKEYVSGELYLSSEDIDNDT